MPASPLFTTSSKLRDELFAARDRAAKALGTTPKRLLTDAALDAVMQARPTTELALRGVKGVGLRAAAALAQDVARLFGSGSLVIEASPEPDQEDAADTQPAEPIDSAVSVSEYLRMLNGALGAYGGIVRGEVTEAREYPSGIYFSVKDATGAEGVLNCYLAPYRVRLFAHLITHGAELRLAGAPRIAPRKGSFSFQVEAIEAVGEGALRAAYEQLKRDLDEEGLFDRALPIPPCTRRIGIVTSRAGAVIDDFRKNLEHRGYELLMHDARVEGVRAVPSILQALSWFRDHADRVDVVVVMRGGGSLEDLQAFNSEAVARAVAALPVPVIAAIGHDRDVPIANLAADHSTSTPSIAALRLNQSWAAADAALALGAERLVRGSNAVVARLVRRIDQQSAGLARGSRRVITDVQHRVGVATERLAGRSLVLVHRAQHRVSDARTFLATRLAQATCVPGDQMTRILDAFTMSLTRAHDAVLARERELAIVDPQRTLNLGYSILTDASGAMIRSVADAVPGQAMQARVADGTVSATITHAQPEER